MANKIKLFLPWLAVSFAMLAVLITVFNQFHSGSWQDKIYFDGDNITLALVVKSIIDGDPFRWVFSSQSFLFPEGPLYLIGYLFTQSYKLALLATAYLNFFIVVACLFLIAYQMGLKRQRILSVITVFLTGALLAICLETQPDINRNTIFSLIFLSTYYSGVVLTALLQLGLLFLILRPVQKNKLFFVLIFVAVGSFTYGSNPLYLLQFLIPLATLSFLFFFIKAWRNYGKWLVFLIGFTVVGGLFIRHVFSQHVVASVGSYVKPQLALDALSQLLDIALSAADVPAYLTLWILLLGLYTFNSWCFFSNRHSEYWRNKPTLVLLYGFLLIAPPMMVMGVIVSGNYHTRYFLPAPIFIFICTAISIGLSWPSRKLNSLNWACLALCLGIFLHHIADNSPQKSTFEQDVGCYSAHAEERPMISVAGYWSARYLKLYGPKASPVYQVETNFKPFNWLSNVQDFEGIVINTVIVSKSIGHGHLNVSDVAVLGTPTAVLKCAMFDIYYYGSYTLGYQLLNQRIRAN